MESQTALLRVIIYLSFECRQRTTRSMHHLLYMLAVKDRVVHISAVNLVTYTEYARQE